MRPFRRTAVASVAVCAWLLTLAPPAAAHPPPVPAQCAGTPAPWLDQFRGPDQRARLAIAQMTLDEKIAEMGSLRDAEHFRETPAIPRLCIPALRLNNGSEIGRAACRERV